ncbi:MAG TPA: hypothetical protein VFC47_10460 [Caulobacteraceae bacterium]|nr:hypothetical protein [Caulobacteraceae bacterium]
MHDTILDRLGDGLTDFLAELRRLWRGPEPALGERAAEIRGRILRLRDPSLEAMFSDFVTACIQARALRRPSALRKVIRNFQRPARKAPFSGIFRSKTGGNLPETVKNSAIEDLLDEVFWAFDRLEWERFLGVDEGRGQLQ